MEINSLIFRKILHVNIVNVAMKNVTSHVRRWLSFFIARLMIFWKTKTNAESNFANRINSFCPPHLFHHVGFQNFDLKFEVSTLQNNQVPILIEIRLLFTISIRHTGLTILNFENLASHLKSELQKTSFHQFSLKSDYFYQFGSTILETLF